MLALSNRLVGTGSIKMRLVVAEDAKVTEITQQIKVPVAAIASKRQMRKQASEFYRFMSRGSLVSEGCWEYHLALVVGTAGLFVALCILVICGRLQ
jgi:hypothetical protein